MRVKKTQLQSAIIMSKLFSTFASLCVAIAVHGQSLAVFSGDQKVMGSNMEQIDSIVFYADNQGVTPPGY